MARAVADIQRDIRALSEEQKEAIRLQKEADRKKGLID